MSKLTDRDSYLLVDHSNSPGIRPEDAAWSNLPQSAVGSVKVELKTYQCNHCQAEVIVNPERSRPREYCRGCDHYICDRCAAVRAQTGVCRTFQQWLDETLKAAGV